MYVYIYIQYVLFMLSLIWPVFFRWGDYSQFDSAHMGLERHDTSIIYTYIVCTEKRTRIHWVRLQYIARNYLRYRM